MREILPIHSRGFCVCPIIDFAESPNTIPPPFGQVSTHVFVSLQSEVTVFILQLAVQAFVQTPFFADPKSHCSPRLSSSIALPQ